MKRFQMHPEAREEFLDAVRWRNEHRPWTTLDFVSNVNAALSSLIAGTDVSSLVPRNAESIGARRIFVVGYPYQVVFVDRPSVRAVVAIAHFARRPGYWRRRLHNYPNEKYEK